MFTKAISGSSRWEVSHSMGRPVGEKENEVMSEAGVNPLLTCSHCPVLTDSQQTKCKEPGWSVAPVGR